MSTYDELVGRAVGPVGGELSRQLVADPQMFHVDRLVRSALDAAGVPTLLAEAAALRAERDAYREALAEAEREWGAASVRLEQARADAAIRFQTAAVYEYALHHVCLDLPTGEAVLAIALEFARAALSAHQEGESRG